jgi:SNF2 family DNA or RNA helicase
VEVHRLRYRDRVSIEFLKDNESQDIPGPWLKWAALRQDNNFRLEKSRIVLSKSRFLTELPAVRELHFLSEAELDIDSGISDIIDRFAAEREAWSATFRDKTSGLEKSAEFLSDSIESAGFVRKLKPYQWRDLLKLSALKNGANFSVPGAGKTTVLLALYASQLAEQPNLKLLVVAPRNVMGSWDIEYRECFASASSIVRLTNGADAISRRLEEGPQVSIITYEQLRTCQEIIQRFVEQNSVHLVLDESHRAKAGYTNLQGTAVLEIAPSAERRDILSGTPMPQGVRDLCSQFSFLWPLEGDICGNHLLEDSTDVLSQANTFFKPFFTRTTKADLELPPVTYVREYSELPMSPHQDLAYRLLREFASKLFKTLNSSGDDRLRRIAQQAVNLLQVSSNPRLAYTRLKQEESLKSETILMEHLRMAAESETPAKFKALDEIVSGLMERPGEKVVIWSGFVQTVEEIAARFAEHGALTIHGGVKTGSEDDIDFREARVKLFNEDPRVRVLVANPAAGGEGISLHKAAHNAVYFDRSYNATHYLQSVDRIHRLGLADDVITRVYFLECADTIDELVSARLQQKIEAMNTVLDDRALIPIEMDIEESDLEEGWTEVGMDSEDIDSLFSQHLAKAQDS